MRMKSVRKRAQLFLWLLMVAALILASLPSEAEARRRGPAPVPPPPPSPTASPGTCEVQGQPDTDCDGFSDASESSGIVTLGSDPQTFPPCVGGEGPAARALCVDPNSPDLFVILARAGPTEIPTNPLEFVSAPVSDGGLGIVTHELTPDQAAGDRQVTSVSPQKAVGEGEVRLGRHPLAPHVGHCELERLKLRVHRYGEAGVVRHEPLRRRQGHSHIPVTDALENEGVVFLGAVPHDIHGLDHQELRAFEFRALGSAKS